MLLNFFAGLREGGVPVSIREYLDLLAGLRARLAFADIDAFYYLSRTILVKDEKHFDRFDRAFAGYFKDIATLDDILSTLIPEDWLRKEFEKTLSDEGGTSPFGAQGYNPEGIRVGPNGGNQRAAKVWEKREFRNLDDSVEIGTRNIKIALRRLRKFARTGAAEELDVPDTIRSTARNAGLLELKMVPERHNSVKVLIFFDVGGSMDPHIRTCEQLFSAARTEFKHMEYFYFHNFIYDAVWRNNARRQSEKISTLDLLHKYPHDYKVIFVGDASMSPYEILQAGGSVEYFNEEAGALWMQRVVQTWPKVVWLNPTPEEHWDFTQSIDLTRQLVEDRMFPMTLRGLEAAMGCLVR